MKHLTPLVLASALALCGCPDSSKKEAPKPAATDATDDATDEATERQPEDVVKDGNAERKKGTDKANKALNSVLGD
jgi:hypothetical protein